MRSPVPAVTVVLLAVFLSPASGYDDSVPGAPPEDRRFAVDYD